LLEYHTIKSAVTVQYAFHAKDLPTHKTIRALYRQFTETGCLRKHKSSGRLLPGEDDERVWASFLHSLKKSTGTAAMELLMLRTAVWRVLHKRLMFKPYRIQIGMRLGRVSL
jgi:hypothetical protein